MFSDAVFVCEFIRFKGIDGYIFWEPGFTRDTNAPTKDSCRRYNIRAKQYMLITPRCLTGHSTGFHILLNYLMKCNAKIVPRASWLLSRGLLGATCFAPGLSVGFGGFLASAQCKAVCTPSLGASQKSATCFAQSRSHILVFVASENGHAFNTLPRDRVPLASFLHISAICVARSRSHFGGIWPPKVVTWARGLRVKQKLKNKPTKLAIVMQAIFDPPKSQGV